MKPQREERAAEALSQLGIDIFMRFLRSVQDDESCIAVRLANEALDDGKTVQEIFFTGDEYGFQLEVTELSRHLFRVEFGCLAGGLAGDGGSWDVRVDPDGAIVRTVLRGYWIA